MIAKPITKIAHIKPRLNVSGFSIGILRSGIEKKMIPTIQAIIINFIYNSDGYKSEIRFALLKK